MDAPELLALCDKYNLASVNRSPLARGALSGKYNQDSRFAQDDVRHDPWSMEHFFTPTLDKLDDLRSILTSNGRTLAQGALAWIWGRSPKTIPIPGFRNAKQVQENALAMQFGSLLLEQTKQVDELLGRS